MRQGVGNKMCELEKKWMMQYSFLCSSLFSSKGNISVETILYSCNDVLDLAVEKCWFTLESPLTGAPTSTSLEVELWPVRNDEVPRAIIVSIATTAIGDDFMLMYYNCRPCRAHLVEDFVFEEGTIRMERLACSPDINPTEYVWDILGGRSLTTSTNSPRTEKTSRWIFLKKIQRCCLE